MNKKSYRNLEFLESDEARDIRILSEYNYIHSELIKKNVKDTIVLFGSARIQEEKNIDNLIRELGLENYDSNKVKRLKNLAKLSKYYKEAEEISKLITEWGLTIASSSKEKRLLVCTGGGPGIMEAGNKGAKLAGGTSLALNISLPFEKSNLYTDPELTFEFHYFFMRKLWFLHLCKAVIVFPGGYGTIDELFETLTLLQTQKTKKNIPVLLYGNEFWNKVLNLSILVDYMLISERDLELINFVDSPKEVITILKEKVVL